MHISLPPPRSSLGGGPQRSPRQLELALTSLWSKPGLKSNASSSKHPERLSPPIPSFPPLPRQNSPTPPIAIAAVSPLIAGFTWSLILLCYCLNSFHHLATATLKLLFLACWANSKSDVVSLTSALRKGLGKSARAWESHKLVRGFWAFDLLSRTSLWLSNAFQNLSIMHCSRLLCWKLQKYPAGSVTAVV